MSRFSDPHSAQPDDVDRLFARLERAGVPDDLTARVLASTVARAQPGSALVWPWLLAGLGAIVLLAMAGYLLGASLAASDGLDIIEALTGDLGLLTTSPGDVFAALGEVIPWSLVALAGVSAALLNWAAGRVATRVRSPLRGRQTA
jgi:hypothetical protein